jgi:hypothetical protein
MTTHFTAIFPPLHYLFNDESQSLFHKLSKIVFCGFYVAMNGLREKYWPKAKYHLRDPTAKDRNRYNILAVIKFFPEISLFYIFQQTPVSRG